MTSSTVTDPVPADAAPVGAGNAAPAVTAGRPGLFILRTVNPSEVAAFYAATLRWDLDGETFTLDGAALAGVTARGGGWLPMFAVESLAESLTLVQQAGGTLTGRRDDDRGRQALVADPTGTAFGLWEIGTGAGSHQQGHLGTVSWVEQKTRDQDAATSFLSAVFGYSVVGPKGSGNVRVLTGAGSPLFGGVMQFDDRYSAEQPPFWLLYVEVEDVAETIGRAVEAGGSVWFPLTQTPLGPLAYVRDPAGNAIALVAISEGGRAMIGARAGGSGQDL